MPILQAEKCLYPDDLLETPLPGDDESRWWVLCTKPRQEKALSRHLDAHQVPFYLPLIKNSRIYRGRRRTSYNPLFPGYVFMQGGDQERIISLSSARLARILPVEDAEQLRAELRSIARLIATDAPLAPESRLVAGHRVRVRNGPFGGLEGTVLKRRGRNRLLVSVNFVQCGASIDIDDCQLEYIG